MSQKIVLRPASSNRRKNLLLGEVVGGTAAECAAICCCCPCGLANILVLAICKVPAGLFRRALRKKRRERRAKEGLSPAKRHGCACENGIGIHRRFAGGDGAEIKSRNLVELDKEAMELEKEMWDRFYSNGFWRSPSQRDSSETLTNAVLQPPKENS